MELYSKWLNFYEQKSNEELFIGVIFCATTNREIVEMLEMNKTGIAIAEYRRTMLPKALLEEKMRLILLEAQEIL
jgi:hypothetical protein